MVPFTPLHFLIQMVAGWTNRRQQAAIMYLIEENRVLREKLGGGRLRFSDSERMRLGRAAKGVGRKALLQLQTVVTPDTLLRWYRLLVAKKYDGASSKEVTNRSERDSMRTLVVRMASENPTWGYRRIVGALKHLGHSVSHGTVARWLAQAGLEPAPERSKGTTWRAFLDAHWGAITAADFFTVEAVTWAGLTRFHVLFVMDLKSRVVAIAGVTRAPDATWVKQTFRNLLDACDGFLLDKSHIILDRDPLFTDEVRAFLGNAGVEPVRIPPSSPNCNAYAERFVGSVRRECLDRIIPLGRRHLQNVLTEYVNHHYLAERPHQGLGNEHLAVSSGAVNENGQVVRCSRLGGLLNCYHREAA